jgi:hypothetical protein
VVDADRSHASRAAREVHTALRAENPQKSVAEN